MVKETAFLCAADIVAQEKAVWSLKQRSSTLWKGENRISTAGRIHKIVQNAQN